MTDMWNLKCDTKDLFTKQKQKLAGIENKLSEISLLLFPNQAIFPNRDSYI